MRRILAVPGRVPKPTALGHALCAALVLTGCAALLAGCAGPPQPRFVPARPLDRGIEKFDFGDAKWQSDAGPITLHGGHAALPGTVDDETADISSGPFFSDVDGDHDEDAAIELHQGGQGFTLAWYVWVWRDGTAHQLLPAFADNPRCGGNVDSVKPVTGGFQVREREFSPESACVEGGTTPVTYTIGMRNGYLVQIAPILGPLPICNPARYTEPVHLSGPVTPRAAPAAGGPAIATNARYAMVTRMEGVPPVDGWMKLLFDDGKQPPYCGYLSADAIR